MLAEQALSGALQLDRSDQASDMFGAKRRVAAVRRGVGYAAVLREVVAAAR